MHKTIIPSKMGKAHALQSRPAGRAVAYAPPDPPTAADALQVPDMWRTAPPPDLRTPPTARLTCGSGGPATPAAAPGCRASSGGGG